MKNTILKSALTLLILGVSLQAAECYNAKTIDVTWTSYKTMAKIGVGGNFSDTALEGLTKNAPTAQAMLKDAKVTLSLKKLDAHNPTKNSNIAEFFVSNLSSEAIRASIVSIDKKKLIIAITLNKKTLNIPMNYIQNASHIKAEGFIDALDFDLVPALRTLNKNVSGHKNKGWNDISIAFDIPFTTGTCK